MTKKSLSILYIFVLLALALNLFSQETDAEKKIKELFLQNKYSEITTKYTENTENYSAMTLFYIARSFFNLEDDSHCLFYIDKAIAKDPKNAEFHFIKGLSQHYSGQSLQGIESIKKAVELDPSKAVYDSGLGDVYFDLKNYEKSLAAYLSSVKKQNPPDRAFVMIPQVYFQLGQAEKALEANYRAKEKIAKDTASYINVLYNIGLLEYLRKNYPQAEKAYLELLAIDKEDYQIYAKLIQVYYGMKEYAKAAPLKAVLYEAHKASKLKGNLAIGFCFDQFSFQDKTVMAYERFADSPDESDAFIYYKHVFYVVNKQNKIECSVQTEADLVLDELGLPKYLIGMDKGNSHFTFNIGFNDDFNYDELKNTVIAILEGKIKPAASSSRTAP